MSRNLHNEWPATINAEYYKLFAERVVELTDAASLDSYRVHALSTLLKMRELVVSCDKVTNKHVPKKVLEPIVAEVSEALNNDLVVRKILSKKGIPIKTVIPDFGEATEEILSRMQLAEAIILPEYREVCEREIVENCTGNISKNTLLVLAKLYTAYLCGSGFHRRYVYDAAIGHFSKKMIGRCTKHLLTSFFTRFKVGARTKHDVVLCGSTKFLSFMEGVFGLPVYEDEHKLKSATGRIVPPEFAQGSNKKLMFLKDIPAMDPFSAVVAAENILGVSRSFLFIYPSGLKGTVDNDAHVFSGRKNEGKRISRKTVLSISTSQASRPESVSNAARSFSRLAFSDVGSHSDAGERVFRALNSAALAGNSTDAETQLVTLWSAFEALLPPPTKDETNPVRILHFAKLIVPALSVGYLRSKYDFFIRDLTKLQKREIVKILDAHSTGKSTGEKLAHALSDDNKTAIQLASVLSGSPLLINRIHKLFELTQSPKKAISKLSSHEERLNWQIHRIYRERNEIVHSGSSSPFLIPLVENAFFYFRLVASRLEAVHTKYEVAEPHGALQLVSSLQVELKRHMQETLADTKTSKEEKQKTLIKWAFST